MRETRILMLMAALIVGGWLQSMAAERPKIVDEGKPNAQIVISENPQRPRMTGFGALELQRYIEKMTGARLPIVTKPTGDLPVKIYLGESEHTDKLGINAKGLKHGAFRIKSGDDYLVLLGQDRDFAPPVPWPRNRRDIPRARKAWDEKVGDRTDGAWAYPYGGVYRSRWHPNDYEEFMAEHYGEDNKHVWNPRGLKHSNDYQGPGMGDGFWLNDQGGAMNAVYDYLRSLGVRWYMPGELGEVVPKVSSIDLPKVDKTIRPDFPLRCWLGARNGDFEGLMWKRRIGIESAYETLGMGGTHGMAKVMLRPETKRKHPEYYAKIGGYRMTAEKSGGAGEPCFSSEGLVKESVAYLGFRFGEYREHMVQFSPPDGLVKCECEKCWDVPVSNLVFGFLDKVGRGLIKKYPEHVVLGAAYTSYKDPPESIDKFGPNVATTVNNCGRPSFNDPKYWREYWKKIEGWKKKIAPGNLMRVENNRFEVRSPVSFPVIHPHAMAKDLRALKGISMGDRNEISIGRKTCLNAPGCSHLTLYVNARFLWDADQDVDELLDEYYEKFYGPAAEKMKAAFELSEANSTNPRMRTSFDMLDTRIKFLKMLHAARDATPEGSDYRQRVQTIIDEIVPLEKLLAEKERAAKMGGDPRGGNPVVVGGDLSDGDTLKTYHLKTLKTGEKPDVDTQFAVGWDDVKSELVFTIRCEEPDIENMIVTDTVWMGDSVAILLEPPNHSYYQLELNPNGVLFDADRFGRRLNDGWKSMAKVVTEKGDDDWTATVRIPVVSVEKGQEDPNHFVVGPKPSKENPWYFNLGRVRMRAGKGELDRTAYAFSPTGGNYHVLEKFAKLVTE